MQEAEQQIRPPLVPDAEAAVSQQPRQGPLHDPSVPTQALARFPTTRRKPEFHHTPVHGSWLNMAELEFSLLARQCVNRRIGDRDTLATEIAAWEAARNEQRAAISWQFTVEDARRNLDRLHLS